MTARIHAEDTIKDVEGASTTEPERPLSKQTATVRDRGMRRASTGARASSMQRRMLKTKMCIHNLSGRCNRGDKCSFAHSAEELRQPPDLHKTRLCPDFLGSVDGCPRGAECKFAHGEKELRWTVEYYKMSLCPVWAVDGSCPRGDECRWAHGLKDLRKTDATGITAAAMSTPKTLTSRRTRLRGPTVSLSPATLFSAKQTDNAVVLSTRCMVDIDDDWRRATSKSNMSQLTDMTTDEDHRHGSSGDLSVELTKSMHEEAPTWRSLAKLFMRRLPPDLLNGGGALPPQHYRTEEPLIQSQPSSCQSLYELAGHPRDLRSTELPLSSLLGPDLLYDVLGEGPKHENLGIAAAR